MNLGLYRITENSDGTVSFESRPTSAPSANVPIEGDYLLHETFDNCNGEGGNSGGFGGTLTMGTFSPDLDVWDATVAIGADRCGRFGNSSTPGFVNSPSFTAVSDTMTLSFRAEGKCLRDPMIYLGRIGIRFDNADGVRTFLINCGDFFIAAHSPPIQCAGFMEAACKLHTAIVLKMGKCGAHNRCAVMMAEKIKSRICQI